MMVTHDEISLATIDQRLLDPRVLGGDFTVGLPLGLLYVQREMPAGAQRAKSRSTRRLRDSCAYFEGSVFGTRMVDVVRALGFTERPVHLRRAYIDREMAELSSTWTAHRGLVPDGDQHPGEAWHGVVEDGAPAEQAEQAEPDATFSEHAALTGGRIIRGQSARSSKMPTPDKTMGSTRVAIGASASLVVLYGAIAEMRSRQAWPHRMSIAVAARAAAEEIGDWVSRAGERHRHCFVCMALREHRRLQRAAEAVEHPELKLRIGRLSAANALRSEVAAFRHAAWPPADSIDHVAESDVLAYNAEAVAIGVRAGLLHAESPAIPLADVRGLTPWHARPSSVIRTSRLPNGTSGASGRSATSASNSTAPSWSAHSSEWSGTSSSGALTSVCDAPRSGGGAGGGRGDLEAISALFACSGVAPVVQWERGVEVDGGFTPLKRPREWVWI